MNSNASESDDAESERDIQFNNDFSKQGLDIKPEAKLQFWKIEVQ